MTFEREIKSVIVTKLCNDDTLGSNVSIYIPLEVNAVVKVPQQ